MARVYSQYVEIAWPADRPDVEELAMLKRLERGDIEAGIELICRRSGNVLTPIHVRHADLDSWEKWLHGMHTGMKVANAPSDAKKIEDALSKQIALPDNMRLRIEVVDDASRPSQVDLDRLFKGLNLGPSDQMSSE